MILAGQCRRQIEAKTVNAHLLDPEAQTVHDHAQHEGMRHIHRIAAARIIDIIARLSGYQAVIGRIVKTAIAQGWPAMVALGCVIIDHIENDLDAMSMKFPHHVAKTQQALRTKVTRFGDEKPDCVVAPVIAQSALDQKAIINEGMHWQQFDGGDAKLLQMLQHRLRGQPFISAFDILGDGWVLLGEALHMGFIDQRIVPVTIRPLFNALEQFRM